MTLRGEIAKKSTNALLRSGDLQTVKLMVQSGIDPDDFFGTVNKIDYGLSGFGKNGAGVKAVLCARPTPLILARDNGHWDVVDYLETVRKVKVSSKFRGVDGLKNLFPSVILDIVVEYTVGLEDLEPEPVDKWAVGPRRIARGAPRRPEPQQEADEEEEVAPVNLRYPLHQPVDDPDFAGARLPPSL